MRNEAQPAPDVNQCIEPVQQNLVILLDHSDHATLQTHEEIIARSLKQVQTIPSNTRVTLFAISRTSQRELKPLFSACRPPDDGSILTENVKKVRRSYEENFRRPLQRALAQSIAVSDQSPLAQSITDISLTQYLRAPRNTLLVFSDMLENTKAFSLYRCSNGDGAIQEYRQARAGAQERPQFSNATILLNFIPRYDLPKETLSCRATFWNWFFGDNKGAGSIQSDFLPGGDTK